MYQPVPLSAAINAEMKALADRVHRSAGGRGYVIYGMLDPREPDPSGRYASKLVYVGLTKDIGTRIRRRYHDAFDGKPRFSPCIEFIRVLAAQRMVPGFRILERVPSKAAAVVAETTWAQRLLAEGHCLINQHPSQRRLLEPRKLSAVLQKRLWLLSIQEAIEGGLRVKTNCHWCGRVGQLQPAEFLAYTCSAEQLKFVRTMARRCVQCGEVIDHKVLQRHEPDAVRRAGYMEWEH